MALLIVGGNHAALFSTNCKMSLGILKKAQTSEAASYDISTLKAKLIPPSKPFSTLTYASSHKVQLDGTGGVTP